MRILVVGESCLDVFQYYSSKRLAPENPVAILEPAHRTINPGMASNVKRNLEKLGAEVDIITNENWKDITKTRIVHEDSNHMFCRIDKNDDKYGEFPPQNIDYKKYDAVIISDYNKSFISPSLINEICMMHPLVFIDTKKIIQGSYFNHAKYIKININEYEKSKPFIPVGLDEKFIITLGKNGAQHKGKIYPVSNVPIKDVSGGGDSFLSGLVFKYIETNDIDASITFANECASKVVQEKGVTTI